VSITVTAGELKGGLQAAIDLLAAARDGFKNMPENEAVLLDAEQIAQPLVGGALSVVLGPIVGPILIDALVLVVEYNRSAEPGSLTREGSGNKGSDPWQ
jgi:hypothetical protein